MLELQYRGKSPSRRIYASISCLVVVNHAPSPCGSTSSNTLTESMKIWSSLMRWKNSAQLACVLSI